MRCVAERLGDGLETLACSGIPGNSIRGSCVLFSRHRQAGDYLETIGLGIRGPEELRKGEAEVVVVDFVVLSTTEMPACFF